jgi:hypothetical protein
VQDEMDEAAMMAVLRVSHDGFFRLHIDLQRVAGAICSA